MFEASLDASLEIHSGMMASSILSDTISCRQLLLEDDSIPSVPTATESQSLEYRNEGIPSEQLGDRLSVSERVSMSS